MGGPVQVISDLGGSITNLSTGETSTRGGGGGGGGGGGIFGDISDAFTQITQPIEKAVTAGVEDTSKNLTSALQPVEKAVNAVAQDPKALAVIAFAVAAPYAAAELAPYLSGLGEYATVAANAITNITAQVAQGVPIEKATENALVNVAVSGASSAAQQQIGKVISSPGVTNAITSTVSSGLATAAKGGSQADVEKAMTAGLAGSTASTIYKEAVDSSSDVMSKAVGGAASGAVTGGTEGAVLGGLQSAASALAQPSKKEPPSPEPPPVAPPLDQTAAEDARLARQETAAAGTDVPPAVEPKQGAYLPDSATMPTTPTDTTTTTTAAPSKSDIFTSVYITPKSKVGGSASTEALSQALGTTTGLTASRGAGEIEGTGTGGQRKKVWNEESLKLKDALGV
jgi:hypothetical protein